MNLVCRPTHTTLELGRTYVSRVALPNHAFTSITAAFPESLFSIISSHLSAIWWQRLELASKIVCKEFTCLGNRFHEIRQQTFSLYKTKSRSHRPPVTPVYVACWIIGWAGSKKRRTVMDSSPSTDATPRSPNNAITSLMLPGFAYE